ncbi:MAG: polysaccharide biosynthesis/export family protein [Bacteroidales bacterium]|nr:polysaccharide biosynthesis/export family protein [Bacteroidales bacterium]
MNKISIFFAGLTALMLASCAAPANVVYFQDSQDKEISTEIDNSQIRLRPGDKISIIVNCNGVELMNQFNMPYVARYVGSTQEISLGNTGISGYIIDSEGKIDFPVVGEIPVAGMTRPEVAKTIRDELTSRDLVRDPVVTVDYMNLYFSVMGEVAHPGRFAITRDNVNILEALSMAGDLTILGRRDNVMVLREENGVQKTYLVDLRSAAGLSKSPVFYINQNDVIYVSPNAMRTRQSTVNGNNVVSTSFWISIASLAATLVSTITVVAMNMQNMK